MRDSYVMQNGCHNCKFGFRLYNIESESEYYCTHNAPPRPLSGSFGMSESFNNHIISSTVWSKQHNYNMQELFGPERKIDEYRKLVRPLFSAMHKAWDDWAKDREVKPWGICDIWEICHDVKAPL